MSHLFFFRPKLYFGRITIRSLGGTRAQRTGGHSNGGRLSHKTKAFYLQCTLRLSTSSCQNFHESYILSTSPPRRPLVLVSVTLNKHQKLIGESDHLDIIISPNKTQDNLNFFNGQPLVVEVSSITEPVESKPN